MRMHKLILIVIAFWVVLLAGCNTVHGFGRDLEDAGTAIQRKSK